VRRYNGTKEDVYLADFKPDLAFSAQLSQLGIANHNVLVLMRPPAHDALYHRFQNKLFDEALNRFLSDENVRVVLLPRNDAQRSVYSSRPNLIVPLAPLDGPNLIAASDLVISAGGTINREAAALGVPVASIYAGQWAAVDEQLVKEGRLTRIRSAEDLKRIVLTKKEALNLRRSTGVIDQILSYIFEN
jgi:predicted glycosyltransferase